MPRVEHSRLRFYFERVTVESNLSPYRPHLEPWRFETADEAGRAAIDAALAGFVPLPEHFEGQFSRLHAALTEGGPPPVTLADSRASIELLTAAYYSARDRRQRHPADRAGTPVLSRLAAKVGRARWLSCGCIGSSSASATPR